MEPDEHALACLLAQLWLRHGAPEKARTLLRGVTRLAPEAREPAKLLAWAEVACGDGPAALDAVERYRLLDPFADAGSPIELVRARALLLAGRNEDARVAFARFVQARRALLSG
jgi:predicted Zn-dependent protease